MSEGFRAALTPVHHMSLWAIYPVLLGFTMVFTALGLRTFRNRVLS
jgi:ABC-2 type transport system permease protein